MSSLGDRPMRYTSFLDIWMKNPLPKDVGKPARETS